MGEMVKVLHFDCFPPQGDPLHWEYPDHDPGGAAAGSVQEVQELQRGLCAHAVIFVFWQRKGTSHLVLQAFQFYITL